MDKKERLMAGKRITPVAAGWSALIKASLNPSNVNTLSSRPETYIVRVIKAFLEWNQRFIAC